MSDVLKGIDEDVPFDNAAADALIASSNGAATAIDGQIGSRASWVSTGKTDFKGHFSDLFTTNASTARADGSELSSRLREVAKGALQLKKAAAAEQARREKARKWKQDQDGRNGFEKGWDSFWGEDKPPVGPADPPIGIPVSPPRSGTRQTPAPGSGGDSSGTSSARPSDLRTFATSSSQANSELTPKASKAKADLATFVANCTWGTLDASGVMTGFDKWLQANGEDVKWANVVAAAFEKAGSVGGVSTLSNSALAATLRAAGVNETRQDLTIPGPMAIGHPPTTGYAVDPVNTSTGNFVETEIDLAFAGACEGLQLSRTYNSLGTSTGAFGPGWSSWTDAGIRFDDEAAYVVLPDGRQLQFPRLGAGWDRAAGESTWLEALDDATVAHRAADNQGSQWSFSRSGDLVEHSTGPGTAVRLVWEDRRLVRLAHERGRWIELSWSGTDTAEARVSALRASDGRETTYTYDERGRLVLATTGLGSRRYDWRDEPDLITAVVGADGVVEAANEYDDQGRVVHQRTAHGRETRLVYLAGRVSVVSDVDGERSNTYVADERGRLVAVVDSDEQRQSMAYDEHGNLVLVTERDGSTTVNEYDERGRLVRKVSPSGADLTQTWDARDRLTSLSVSADESDAPALSTLEYADEQDRSPSVIVDPEGGRTELEWESGLLLKVVDPTGVTVRFAYDVHGELLATTDAAGNTARLERDRSGRVVAAVTPSGATTRFAYDAVSGLLSSRVDPDGAVNRFEHTEAGRLSAVIDPLGGRTELEYADSGENVRTIDQLGRVMLRRYDDLGNVSGFELPDGTSWEFTRDAMSRLREVRDGSGAVSTYDYDVNGALVATTTPLGDRTEVRTDSAAGTARISGGPVSTGLQADRLGRLVASEQADGSTILTRYDRCGRPVELVDAEGGLTRIERDAAGRASTLTRPGGGVLRYEYDVCGRPSAVVDELGERTTLTYDVDGRVVAETDPTGEVMTREYDACGRPVKYRRPGVGTTTCEYDLAGHVVLLRDPGFGRRRFRYDAAGQLVEAVNGNGGVTRWEYDVNGRAVAITDPDGGTTRREFDAMNHVVAETDPLGRTTRGGYDESGRQTWQRSADGELTEWSYDAAGRVRAVSVDGRLMASIDRDHRGRRTVVRDLTRPGVETRHELDYDARGRLVSRTRDGRGLAWTYDADGRRTSRTGPDGDVTTYERDLAGRITAVRHPLLGAADFEHDAAGRVTSVSSAGLRQEWTYRDGFATAYSVQDGARSAQTLIDRDDLGHVVSLNRGGAHTTYGYDEAAQLIESRTAGADGVVVARWRYDSAGRLVAESHDGAVRSLTYDAAGQLVSSASGDGSTRAYSYDVQGRRTSVSDSDGSSRSFAWTSTGYLSGVVDRGVDGRERRHSTAVDALGELSRIDGADVFLDSADAFPGVTQVGANHVVATGLTTGMSETGWTAPGWRGLRTEDGGDPWGTSFPAAGVGPAGEIGFAGLEWLGARVYDSSTRGFLSVDPLEAVAGSGWSGNPYSYAGNDPLHALDPTGMRPATDADLQAYADAHQGTGMGQWLKNNWEYVAGGAMVLAGGVLIATGVGGPAGMMLVSAGADTIIQKATTGKVNWGEVVISGALGGVGGVGAGAASKIGLTGWKAAATAGAIDGAWQGGVAGTGGYMLGPGPHTLSGFAEAGAYGVGGGMVGGAGGGVLEHGINSAVMRHALSNAPVTPGPDVAAQARSLLGNPGDTVVLGRQPDTAIAKDWPGHTVLDTDQWTPELNHEWVQGAIDYQRPIYLASPIEGNLIQTTGDYAGQPSIFAGELDQLKDAGYTRSGDYMMPPGAP